MGLTSQNLHRNNPQRKDLKIIEMEEEDIDDVLSIENLCFTSPWTRHSFNQELSLEYSKILIAKKFTRDHERIVGHISFWFIADEVHILNLATHPDFHRQGIATNLVNSCLESAILTGAKAVTLEVRKSNRPAITLYEKFAFEAKGIRQRYYSDNSEDAVIMWLKLGNKKDRLYL